MSSTTRSPHDPIDLDGELEYLRARIHSGIVRTPRGFFVLLDE